MEYRAEAFDLMQLLFDETGFNDHQLHCEIGLESPPDEGALRRAVALSLEAMPILATRFEEGPGGARWVSLPAEDLGRAFVATGEEAAFEAERTYRICEDIGPQLRLCLLSGKRCAIAVTMNHMIADAAGFKDYLYALCEAYSRLLADPGYSPPAALPGDRGLGEALRGFGLRARAAALLGRGGASNKEGSFRFPLAEIAEASPFIAARSMSREKVAGLKAYCRERNATLNDAALAAFYRVLARRLGKAALRRLEIPLMVDMRRYLPRDSPRPLRNLASMAVTRVRQSEGESFDATLRKAKACMDALKRGRIGLGGFMKMSLLFSIFGTKRALPLLRRGLRNPLICMTNVGELDSGRLRFAGSPVLSAYLCGSIKRKPHFQLALSGFDGTITLSSNLYGNAEDRERIGDFLREVEEELDAAGMDTL